MCHRVENGVYRSAVVALALMLLSVPVFCDEEQARTPARVKADENEEAAGRRRAQAFPKPPRDQPLCVQLEEQGEQEALTALCATAAGMQVCPNACATAAAAVAPSPETRMCAQQAARGTLMCASDADLCPEACANSTGGAGVPGMFTRDDGTGLFQTSCIFLLKLQGGCAYDLSQEDTALAPNTRVSTVCPNECSGHGQCVAEGSALDVAFLGLTDSSGHGGLVELQGSACVDGGGVTFDGEGWVTITPGQDYGNSAAFAVTFWVLPAETAVWTPHRESTASQTLFVHPPRSQSSIAGGISLSLSRGVWLDAWFMHASIAGTVAEYALAMLRDATPKWTHVAIVVEPTEIRVYEDGELIQDIHGRDAASRKFVGTMDLGSQLFLGGSTATYGWPPAARGFHGSVAMLQLYASALSVDDLRCVFAGGTELVHNQRMAQDTPSACRDRVSTGCTNAMASNFDINLPLSSIDDGSCEFEEHEAAVGEHGIVHVTDDWQRVPLTGSYTHPIVLCGVVTATLQRKRWCV